MTTKGKCLCGAIEVTSDEKPDQIIACYCESCQKACGGGASFNIIKTDDGARLSKGETKIYNDTAEEFHSFYSFGSLCTKVSFLHKVDIY